MDPDIRRVGRVVAVLCLVALAGLAVALFAAGAHQNQQDNRLHRDGVTVDLRVSGCTGQLGGSGSNAAGYSCRGSFTLGGHRYDEAIPGSSFHTPGSTLRVVTVPGDPALVSPVGVLAGEHASWRVFLLPAGLLVVLLLLVGAIVLRRRRRAA